MGIVVQKYGGTSVENHEKLLAVAARVAALKRQGLDVVVVVSAQGGTTDDLLREAKLLTADPSQRELDMLMTAGERISMALLAIALNSIGCPAVSFTGSQVGIITDTRHTDARILEVRPTRVLEEIGKGNVVVVGGFQGVSTAKDVTTLGRGGSDTTAVALAAALGADRCEILTDVDAVYTADPRIVTTARRIEEIGYEDMAELARYGAVVLKEECVRFAERSGISLWVASSAGGSQGTIVLERATHAEPPVVGLSLLEGASVLSWQSAGLDEVSRLLARQPLAVKFLVLAGRGGAAAAVTSSDPSGEGLPRVTGAESRPAALVCVAGAGAALPGAVAETCAVAERAGVRVLAATSSARSTVLAVQPDGSDRLLRGLHDAFLEPPADRRA